ncbi:chemotaxis protein CheW [Moorellaceae bacterium AZ2]
MREESGGQERQYVVFQLANESYGIAIEYLQEIIRVPQVVRVPLVPPYVRGLANLRGTILTIYDTRLQLGLPDGSDDESSRVVVVRYNNRQAGYIVDRIEGVRDISPEAIEEFRAEETEGEKSKLVTRAAKLEDNHLVLLLEVERMLETAASPGERGGAISHSIAGQVRRETVQLEEEKQLLTFRVGGEEYGLNIADVKEIVHLPDRVNVLPDAPPYILGVISLRQRVLPLLSLRRRFDLPEKQGGRVVVAYLGSGRRVLAGLVVDSVAEVLRVSERLLEPVPKLFQAKGENEVAAICRIGEERLVFVLDAAKLVLEEGVLEEASGEEEREEVTKRQLEAEQQLVTFFLEGEEFALPIASVREIIRAGKVTAVPGTLPFVRGVLNLRGSIIPVVDLRQRFAYSPREIDEQTRILVCEGRNTVLGLLVDGVKEVLKVPVTQVEPTPDILVADLERRFVSGIAKVSSERNIIILDAAQVLSWEEERQVAALAEAGELEEDTSTGGR